LRDLDRKIRREKHQEELAEIRRKGKALRRGQEQFVVDDVAAALKIYRDMRDKYGKPIPLDILEKYQRHVAGGVMRPGTESAVNIWRQHASEIERQYAIDVSFDVVANVNAYAFVKLKRVETSEISRAESYADFLHEAGHIVRFCGHRKSPCVTCEIAAWRWAQEVARPSWTREMHAEMRRCLPTYKKLATTAEQREIDELVSPMAYYETRVRRARKG
jgi:hypothetical protein